MTFEEEDRLLGALPERATVVVQLGLECGARIQSELLGLRWPDVDLDRQQLHITAVHSKNGKGRVLPLSDGMTATLRTMQATATSDLVFPGRGGRFYHRFKADYFAALHKAKLAGLGIGVHTCRHSWASRMIEAGADLVTLRDLGGWSDLSLVSRYSHFRPQRGADATAAMLALRDTARRPALAVVGSTSTSR